MAVPYVVATAALATGSITYNVPVNVASSTAGDGIIVVAGVGGTAAPALSTVTDSKGNSYTQQQQTSTSPFIAVFKSAGTTALVNGTDQLTLTFASAATGGFGVAVVGTPGMNTVDLNTTPATGNSTAPTVSGTPTASGEIALGLHVWANAGGTGTLGGGVTTQLTQVHPTGGAFTTVAYVSSPTSGVSLTASATIATGAWRVMLLSLEPSGGNATATPATLNASAGFPLASVHGTPFWFTNAAFIVNLDSSDPVTTAKFFNTPAAFSISNSATTVGTVPSGYTCTPMLKYISYGQFWADVTGSSRTISGVTYTPVTINPAYQWLMYDTENWSPNPPSPYASAEAQAEIDDPWTYMANFVSLAHANGYKVLLPPGRDLGNDPTSVNPLSSETLDAWYTRTNLIGTATATGAEIAHIQSQADQASSQFATFWNSGYAQAQTADVQTPVSAGVSTTSPAGVTAPQMYAAAQSVISQAGGFWLNMSSGTVSTAIQFLLLMSGTPAPDVLNATAGFPAPVVTGGTVTSSAGGNLQPGSRVWRKRFRRPQIQVPPPPPPVLANNAPGQQSPDIPWQNLPAPMWADNPVLVFQPWPPWNDGTLSGPSTQGVPLTDTGTSAEAFTASQPTDLTDTGASAEALAITQPTGLTDTGTSAEALAITQPTPLADTGVSAEALAITQPTALTDTGTSAEAFKVTQPTGLTDTGTSAEALAITQPVPLTDTGTSAEALGLTQPTGLTDTGTSAEALTISQPTGLTDTGTSAETLAVMPGLTDTGTSAETLAVIIVTPVALTDTGTSAEALALTQPTPLTDTGTSAEALALTQPTALTDTGVAADTFQATQPTPLTDTGTGSDALGIMPGLTDTGTSSEALGIISAQPVPLTDTGTSAETLAITAAVPLADTGTSAENLAIMAGLTDSGTSAETVTVSQPTPLTDTGTSAETLTVLPGFTDTGTSAETLTISSLVTVPLTDTGTSAEALALTQPTPLADTGVSAEAFKVTQPTPLADTGVSAETFAATQPTPLTDTGTSAEALTISSLVAIPLTDTGTSAEVLAIVPGFTDTGTSAETLSIVATVALADAGSALEALATPSRTIGFTDTGTSAEALALVAAVAFPDTGASAEQLGLLRPLDLTDSGASTETIGLFIPPPTQKGYSTGTTVGEAASVTATTSQPESATATVGEAVSIQTEVS